MNTANKHYSATQESLSPIILSMMEYGKIGKYLSNVPPGEEFIVADVWPDNHVTSTKCLGNDLRERPDQLFPKMGHSFFVIQTGNGGPNKTILVFTGPKIDIDKKIPGEVNRILGKTPLH